jgi:hypothetical protein
MNMAKTMTMKTAILSGAALLALALAPGAARADSWPQLVTYQGVLLDSRGLAFAAGTYRAEFRLWNAPAGGTNVWGKSYQFSVAAAGEFNLILGDSTGTELSPPLTNALNTAVCPNPNLYLAIVLTLTPSGVVAAPRELAPRQQWVSSAYALKSSVADNTLSLAGQSGDTVLAGLLNKAEVPAGGIRLVGMSNSTAAYLPVKVTNQVMVMEKNVTVQRMVTAPSGGISTDILRGLPGSSMSLGGLNLFNGWNSVPFGTTQAGTNADVWVMVQLPDMTALPATGDYSIRLTANGSNTLLLSCPGPLTNGYQGLLAYPLPANTSWRVYSNTSYPTNLPVQVWAMILNRNS